MKRYVLLALAVFATLGFGALGVWQIERREWKLALIDRVEQRVHAEPIAPPGPAEWPTITRESAEYLRVTTTGHFLPGKETRVTAATALGSGFWVMAPFRTDAGFTVLVNRGFVPLEARDPATRTDAAGADAEGTGEPIRITGLVRMTEPGGGFMRANAPGENRWYSRDVEAISRSQQLTGVAPYFIDAEADRSRTPAGSTAAPARDSLQGPDAATPARAPAANRLPIGGLTVITFRNTHLTYAITWFLLALLTAAFGALVARRR